MNHSCNPKQSELLNFDLSKLIMVKTIKYGKYFTISLQKQDNQNVLVYKISSKTWDKFSSLSKNLIIQRLYNFCFSFLNIKTKNPNLLSILGFSQCPLTIIYSYPQDITNLIFAEENNKENLDIFKFMTFLDKIKIIFEIGVTMNRLHHNDIFGIELSTKNIIISPEKKAIIGFPVIPDFLLFENLFEYYYPAEFLIESESKRKENFSIPLTKESDVYSFGIIMFELLFEENPYNNLKEETIRNRIIEGFKPEFPRSPERKEYEIFKDLIYQCLESNVKKRPSFDEILLTLEEIQISDEFNSIRQSLEDYEINELKLFPLKMEQFTDFEQVYHVLFKNFPQYQNLKRYLICFSDEQRRILDTEKIYGEQLGKTLGRGADGVTYLGFDQTTEDFVANKVIIDKLTKIDLQRLKNNEVSESRNSLIYRRANLFLSEVMQMALYSSHPTFCPFIGFSTSPQGIISKRLYPCSSFLHLNFKRQESDDYKNIEELTETEKYIICFGTCVGLDYLSSQNTAHRDLKPSNLLLNEEKEPFICDFGRTQTNENGHSTMSTQTGTPLYMAPEIHRKENYKGWAIDSYSYGVMTFEILTDEIPFNGQSPNGEDIRLNFANNTKLSKDFQDLIDLCTKYNAEERPKFRDILKKFMRWNLTMSNIEWDKVSQYAKKIGMKWIKKEEWEEFLKDYSEEKNNNLLQLQLKNDKSNEDEHIELNNLGYAIKMRYDNIAEMLIQTGENINEKYGKDDCILSLAIKRRDIKIIKLLLERNINLTWKSTITGDSFLHLALQTDNKPIIHMILKAFHDNNINYMNEKNTIGETPLKLAIQTENLEIIEEMISNGCKIGKEELFESCKRKDKEIFAFFMTKIEERDEICEKAIDFNIKDSKGATLLHFGVKYGTIEFCQFLIEKGIDIISKDKNGKSPIDYGIENDVPLEIIHFLIEKGADQKYLLHRAVKAGAEKLSLSLINEGYDIKEKDEKGNTPLHYCSFSQKINIAKQLLQEGGNINSKNELGETPLLLALKERTPEQKSYVLFLLKNEANPFLVDNYKNNVFHAIVSSNSRKLCELLKGEGTMKLFDEKNNDNLSPIQMGAIKGAEKVVQFMVDQKVDINQLNDKKENILMLASRFDRRKVINLFISPKIDWEHENTMQQNIMHYSAFEGNYELWKRGKEKGIDFNKNDRFAKHSAAFFAKLGECELIIEDLRKSGIEIDQNPIPTLQDGKEWDNEAKLISKQYLFEGGINEILESETLLHFAAFLNSEQLFEKSIIKKEDINVQNKN